MKDLIGIWQNELGSKMNIEKIDNKTITGTYWSAVGTVTDHGNFPFIGTITPEGYIGIVVNWTELQESTNQDNNILGKITTWIGKVETIINQNQQEETIIKTNWTHIKTTPEQTNWNNTLIGNNTFKKQIIHNTN